MEEQPIPEEKPNFEILLIDKEEYTRKIRSAANWFIWIGVLSVLNSFLVTHNVSFIGGLAITQMVDGAVIGFYGEYHRIAALINAAIALIFIIIAIKARGASKIAFIIGLSIYFIDAFIMLYFQEWRGFIFHIIASFFIIKGFREINNYRQVEGQLLSGAIVTEHDNQ